MKRKLWVFGLIAAMSFVFCQGTFAENKPSVVRIGWLGLVNEQVISKAMKFHEKDMGVPVQWLKFDSGRDINTAMASGSLDFGNVGLPPATIGLAAGLRYWAIMNSDVLGAVEALVARPGIKSVKDLVGKTVATPFGSTSHYELLEAIKQSGIDKSKVKILDMSPAEAVAAYIRGDIDAAYIWEPNLHRIVQQGGKIILTSKQMFDRGYRTWDVIVVRPEFAKKYPKFVIKFLQGELRAIDYWYMHPDKTAKIISQEVPGISVGDAKRMMAGTEVLCIAKQLSPSVLGTSTKKGAAAEDIVSVGKFLLEEGRVTHAVSKGVAENFLHPEFLEAIHAKMWK